MTKEQAMQAAKQAVFDATELFETLEKEGRLSTPGGQAREELSNYVAEFISESWVSFDTSPNEQSLDQGDGGEVVTGEGKGVVIV